MAEQYFLSAYMASPDPRLVFSRRHDHSVALWSVRNGKTDLVRVWEFERISGQKHHDWPLFTRDRAEQFIGSLLAEEGLSWEDIDCTWGTPGLPMYRELTAPADASMFPMHSLAHLFSGLLMDTEIFAGENIIALAVDQAPDVLLESASKPYWYAGAVSIRGAVSYFPVESPGPLYSACRNLFGAEEGTLMALATACDFAIEYDVERDIKGFRLFGGDGAEEHPFREAYPFVRRVEASARAQYDEQVGDPRFSAEDNIQSAVMKVVQAACEMILARNIASLCEQADLDPTQCFLSLTGGYALNCPSNSRILDRFECKGLLTPPCPNDAGQALGYGLMGLYADGVLPRATFRLPSAFLGMKVGGQAEARSTFAPWIKSTAAFDPGQFVADIIDGPIAWVSGAAELGPRALGHRSLLADPRSTAAKDRLNEVKSRQWWRPVAPIVLAEHVREWFVTTRESDYMLEAAPVQEDKRELVPAVMHLDGSARYQTIRSDVDDLLYGAIRSFHEATGVPLLCNTSLNDKGEPIVNTAPEAFNFCLRKGVKVLYIDGERFELEPYSPTAGDTMALTGPLPRTEAVFADQSDARDEIWQATGAKDLSDEAFYLIQRSPSLKSAEVNGRQAELLAKMLSRSVPNFKAAAEAFVKKFGPGSHFETGPNRTTSHADLD